MQKHCEKMKGVDPCKWQQWGLSVFSCCCDKVLWRGEGQTNQGRGNISVHISKVQSFTVGKPRQHDQKTSTHISSMIGIRKA